jgi:hypothetical protein
LRLSAEIDWGRVLEWGWIGNGYSADGLRLAAV